MHNPKENLKQIIARKRKDDPTGFSKAERNGSLQKYLEGDMRRAGIDLSEFSTLNQPATTNPIQDVEKYVQIGSEWLDENLFEPHYKTNRAENHMGVAEGLAALKSSKKIEYRLRNLKVFCAISSLMCFGLGISQLMRARLPHAVILLLCSADLLRISYNCYIKNYCSIYINSLGGNVSKVADTIFKFAKSAVGITDSSDDPFVKLKAEIIVSNLIHNTFSLNIYHKIQESLRK